MITIFSTYSNKYHNFNLGSFAILSIHEIELNDKLLEKIILYFIACSFINET